MKVIVDTNVPIVANKAAPQASPSCVITCVRRLQDIQRNHAVVIDDGWRILREYQDNLSGAGRSGTGTEFLLWVLTNRSNQQHCEQVHITQAPNGDMEFLEFPDDVSLLEFDRSDCKFMAVALTHPEHPPILNAVDTDWRDHHDTLELHGVRVEQLCPDAMTAHR
jgi:hypothetical protein